MTEINPDPWLGVALRKTCLRSWPLGTTLLLFWGHGSLSPALFGKDGWTIGSHPRDNLYLSFLRLGTLQRLDDVLRGSLSASFLGFETLQLLNLVPRGTSSPPFLACGAVQRLDVVLRRRLPASFLRCTAELPKYKRLGCPGQDLTSL